MASDSKAAAQHAAEECTVKEEQQEQEFILAEPWLKLALLQAKLKEKFL